MASYFVTVGDFSDRNGERAENYFAYFQKFRWFVEFLRQEVFPSVLHGWKKGFVKTKPRKREEKIMMLKPERLVLS